MKEALSGGTTSADPEVTRAKNKAAVNESGLFEPTKSETKFRDLPQQQQGNWTAGYEWQSANAAAQSAEKARRDAMSGLGNPTGVDVNARVAATQKRLQEANAQVARWNDLLARPVWKYPSLVKAVVEANKQGGSFTLADASRLTNFAAAWTAADAINATQDPRAQTNILISLPQNQRAVVLDILREQQAQRELDEDAAQAKETADLADKATWGVPRLATQGVGEALGEGLLGVAENVYGGIQRVARTYTMGMNYRASLPAGQQSSSNILTDPFLFWDEVGEGQFDQRVVDEAKQQYGAAPVDVILEMQRLKDEGDPYPAATVAAKYYNDPEKSGVIRSLLMRSWDSSEDREESERILGLADKLLSAQNSDLGAMLTTTNPITGEPISVDAWWRGSQPQTALSKGVNVVSTFVLDPLIIGAKARGVFLGAKYGLERLAIDAGTDVTTDILTKPAVNRYLTDLTADLSSYSARKAAGQDASKLGAEIAQRYANYFPEDVLFDMANAGVHSPEAFIKYVNDTNAMLAIERGQAVQAARTMDEFAYQAAQIEARSVYGRMAVQQAAKRGAPLVPRNSMLMATEIRRDLSRAVNSLKPDKAAKERIRGFYEDMNNPDQTAGSVLFADPKAVLAFDSSGGRITRAWDATTRWLAVTPGKDSIYTADARDAKVFYKFARIFMGKAHAEYLTDQWRNASQSQRILMWTGMVRTAAEKRGAYDEVIADRVLKFRSREMTTVGELRDELTFTTDERNLFAPLSLQVEDVDGARVALDDWIAGKVEEFKIAYPEADAAQVSAYEAGLLSNTPDVMESVVRSSPSDFDGQQLALHLWQTADSLAVPNLNDIALITKRSKALNQILGLTPGSAANEFVNWWSLVNLAGIRYSTRNAIEDWTMYALTGGYFMDMVKGRAISTGVREARGQKIGVVARQMRRAMGQAPEAGEPYSFWQHVVLPGLNKEEVAAAHAAVAEGNVALMRDLVVNSVIRQKIGRALNDDELSWVRDYVASDGSFGVLDEITELARHLNLGTMPHATDEALGRGGVALSDGQIVYPRKSFTSVDMTGINPLRYTYWHRALQGVMQHDGAMGRAAVANLDNPEEAVAAVKKAIEEDTKYGYRERLAAFYEANVSTDEFARRYVQDVLNMFSRKDGSLNDDLWRKFVSDTDEGRKVTWSFKNEDGEWQTRVAVKDLETYGKDDQPAYVLGKEMSDQPFVVPTTVSEKIWNMMGNALARISREPIYFANYLRARKGLTEYESQLAARVGPEAAAKAANKIAQDRAITLTMQFTDNPANQTMLAWRMRNFARYWRATEDFYRRVYRMAKFQPMGVYKAWLTLNVLDDTGFIYTDSFGDDYFMYPGDGVVNNALGQVLGAFMGPEGRLYTGDTPVTFGGKIKMLAPSFDPNAALPMFSSPLAALSVKTVTSALPMFQEYEQALLGPYAADQALWQSMMPATVARGLAALNQDERHSAYASSMMAAAKVLTAAGKMPDADASEAELAVAARGLQSVATQVLGIRFGLGYIVPASPQVMENDVTPFARSLGLDGMSAMYRQLVQAETAAGSPDPYASALIKGVSIYGVDFTAYSVPESGSGEDLKAIPEYSYAPKVETFVRENSDLVRDYPTASMFLAPVRDASGEYSAYTRKWLIDNGYKTAPRVTDYLNRLELAEASYVYGVTMDEADRYIAAATTDDQRKAAEEAKKAAKVRVYAAYPGLDAFFMQQAAKGQSARERLLGDEGATSEVRDMVADYYAGKYGPVPKPVEKIAEAISTYDYFQADSKQITGQTQGARDARKQNRINLLANLRDIADEDPNAEMFIRRVMYPLLDADASGQPKD